MRVAMPGVVVVGLMVAVSAAPMAQQGPLVVPIVGSPAAQQQPQPQPTVIPAPVQLPSGASAPPSAPLTQTPATEPIMGATAAASTARKLQLSFNKGAVNLVAQNVTVREILGEWQRQNGCQFVNADKLGGGTVSYEFGQEPELHVIEALLRGAAGYIVAPRSDAAQSGSVCGSVYILATSRPTSTASSYTPSLSSPLAAPLMRPGSPDDEIPPVSPPFLFPQQLQQQPVPNQPPMGSQPAQPAPGGFGPVPIVPIAPGVGRIGGPAGPTPQPGSPMPNGPGRGGG